MTTFIDSTEALGAFENDPGGVDVVVTDNTMPRMSGIEVAERLTKPLSAYQLASAIRTALSSRTH